MRRESSVEIQKLRKANVNTVVNIIGFNFGMKGSESLEKRRKREAAHMSQLTARTSSNRLGKTLQRI